MPQRLGLVVFGVNLGIGLLVAWWVYRDAKSRDSNPLIWAAAVAVSGIILANPIAIAVAFFAYMLLRPRGRLFTCPHCNRRYLDYLAFCPHCGKAVKKECLRCHETMELDATECPRCRMRST